MAWWKKFSILEKLFGKAESSEDAGVPKEIVEKVGKDAVVTATPEVTVKNNINSTQVKQRVKPSHTKESLSSKTKAQLEELASSEFGLKVNRRDKKDVIIQQILSEIK